MNKADSNSATGKDFFSAGYLKEKYDQMAESYMESRSLFDNTNQLKRLASLIPPGAKVLDLGCGTGLPVAKFFADRGCEVLGIDLSDRMIELARQNVPNATFSIKNILQLEFNENYFDLIVSFYCLFHLRKEKQKEAFNKIIRWLKIDGYSYFTLATKEYTGMENFEGTIDFEGKLFPYSHYSLEDYKKIFSSLRAEVISMEKLQVGGETMLWVLLEKQGKHRNSQA